MNPPRSIKGTPGSRIRVILGDSGKDWYLILNHDDGDRQWQEVDWSGRLPLKVRTQSNNCAQKDRWIKEVDFDSKTGSWFMYGEREDGSNGYHWCGDADANDAVGKYYIEKTQVSFGNRMGSESFVVLYSNEADHGYETKNINNDLSKRMNRMYNRSEVIFFVRLFSDGGYCISDSEGLEWCGVGLYLGKELKKSNGTVRDVAMADNGAWILIRDKFHIVSQNVDGNLEKKISDFYSKQQSRINKRLNEIQSYHLERKRQEEAAREAEERRAREAIREAEERRVREAEERRLQAVREAEERQRQRDREAEERRLQAVREAEERQRQRDREVEERRIEEERKIKEERDVLKIETEYKVISEIENQLQERKRCLEERAGKLSTAFLPRLKRKRDDESECLSNVCVICHSNQSTKAVIPCGHMCLCDNCADVMAADLVEKCPICRGPLQDTMRIFLTR